MAATLVATAHAIFPLSMVNTEPENSALLRLHDSLLQDILRRTDIQGRVAASVACRRLARVSAEHPPSVVDLSSDGVHPEACRRYIENAKGAIVTLATARQQQRTACDATSARRFNTGVRCTQVVPYTSGPSAARLAACLPRLQRLALHEATSCLGGMTDEFAVAVAANCPLLNNLEVAFTRYSLPSECFTDAGMMALAAGCPRLSSLSLTNCGAITDRSLYAVAVHCRGLASLALGGYHELISDYGTVVLFQACSGLLRVVLSGKLRRVTDESIEALGANSGGVLREVKLTRSMTNQSLASLGAHCKALRLVDCCKCEPGALTAEGVAALVKAISARAQQPQQANGAETPTEREAMAAAMSPATSATVESNPSLQRTAPTAASAGTPILLRVVLPRGVAAEDVVRLGHGGGDGGIDADGISSAVYWQAVRPPSALAKETAASAAASAGSVAGAATMLKLGATTGCGGVGGTNTRGLQAGGAAAAPSAEAPFEEVRVRLRSPHTR